MRQNAAEVCILCNMLNYSRSVPHINRPSTFYSPPSPRIDHTWCSGIDILPNLPTRQQTRQQPRDQDNSCQTDYHQHDPPTTFPLIFPLARRQITQYALSFAPIGGPMAQMRRLWRVSGDLFRPCGRLRLDVGRLILRLVLRQEWRRTRRYARRRAAVYQLDPTSFILSRPMPILGGSRRSLNIFALDNLYSACLSH